ncbi:MAG: glucan biosynthesis protein [Proteobacteria bacterium]|nr:glucan biosynthesis protein [Pseudomonadota bacterium]
MTEIATFPSDRAGPNHIADVVRDYAKKLSERAFDPPVEQVPPALATMAYDDYRDLRFRPDRAVWRDENLGFQLQFFVAAYIYKSPVDIFLVENDTIRKFEANSSLFDFGRQTGKIPDGATLSFSGFRIHAPINTPDYYDEVIAFQGASYFRGLAKGHTYGLSARALSLNAGGPDPEEFPSFKSFWIERPSDQRSIIVHGLLDSPSVTGAYSFVIAPGVQTTVDVNSWLFPRRDIPGVGIAPLTSMFMKDTHQIGKVADFRPAVHDSEGFAAWNEREEHIWRPLINPESVQTSCFLDKNPKGFGLIQRDRTFSGYQDLEAHYESRPSAWVEPKGMWGAGCAVLLELPTQVEYLDNIVAFWRPDKKLESGNSYNIGYRLTWCDDAPTWTGYKVGKTRVGQGLRHGTIRFVIDFLDPRRNSDIVSRPALTPLVNSTAIAITPITSASEGAIEKPLIERNYYTAGIRVSFDFDPQSHEESDLRLALFDDTRAASEVWIFRWRR